MAEDIRSEWLKSASIKTESIPIDEPLELGRFEQFLKMGIFVPGMDKFPEAKVTARRALVHRLVLDDGTGEAALNRLNQWVAEHSGDGRKVGQSLVLVGETLSFEVFVDGCDDEKVTVPLRREFRRLIWGYRGASATIGLNAVGKSFFVELLQLFELDFIATDRTLRIKGIQTIPQDAEVGWLDRMRAGKRDVPDLPDEDFLWLGPAPIAELNLWSGRFYFRLRKGEAQSTVLRDLTLSHEGKTIKLKLTK